MADALAAPMLESFLRRAVVADILRFISEQRREDLTLDFKLAPRSFEHREERKLLATAISGFANSSGGLIVWGIDARKDDEEIDCAQQAVPIANPDLFLSRLIEYAGQASSPVVAGVEHRLVQGTGGPFALTLVPESDRGPHMAKLGEDRYYKRSGDQFRKMEHFDVADMFGRRRKARLILNFKKEKGGHVIMVSITNEGRGSARAPYLSLKVPPEFNLSLAHGFDSRRSLGLTPIGERDGIFHFGASADEVIHPRQTLPVVQMFANALIRDGVASIAHITGPQIFRYELTAEDCEMTVDEIVLAY